MCAHASAPPSRFSETAAIETASCDGGGLQATCDAERSAVSPVQVELAGSPREGLSPGASCRPERVMLEGTGGVRWRDSRHGRGKDGELLEHHQGGGTLAV